MRKIAALAATLVAAVSLQAQDYNSPYSIYGYGIMQDNVNTAQRSMGGIGYALRSKSKINVKNPASYAAIDSLTFLFDMGVDVGAVHSKQEGLTGKKTLGGLNYVTMQVPIGKWMGASLGLLPYSSVGYKFGEEVPDAQGNLQYQGSGGISELYLGWAARPVKGLSVGFNAGYLFGNIIHDNYIITGSATSLYESVYKVRDYNIKFGLQYGFDFGKKRAHTLTAGATFNLGRRAHGHAYGVKYDVTNQSTNPDTIGYASMVHRFSFPWNVGAGLTYQWAKRLTVGVDFTYQPWKDAKFDGIEGFSDPQPLANRYKIQAGAEFIPAFRGNYLKRISYRVGGFYDRDYIMVRDNNVRQWGITCGFGLPTPMRTTVNVGLEYRHRNSYPVATLSENYFMVSVGVALNELWFMASKIR